LSISEGRPQLLEQQQQEKVPFRIKPKYFSRFSTPFFSKRHKDYTNQDLIIETEEDQNKADNQRKSGQNEQQEEAENTVRGVVNENYSRWLLLGWFLFFSFTSVAITLLILLWPEYQSGKIYDVLLSDNKSFLFVKSEVAQSYLMQTTPESSFIQAVKKENLAEVERFIDEGVDLELKDLNGYTPLMHAVRQQNTELVKLLAEYGANVDTSDGLEDTPLVWASSMKNEAIVKVLLEHGADPDKGNFSPLMWAAYYGNLRLVKMFLESRANLNSRTNEGWTALMWAAERGNLQVIWELLKRGASVNMQNNNGQTALMLAAGRGRTGSVGLLLNKGGDAFVVDFNKKTAADYARSKQRNEVLQILEKEFELR
jgi:ankyrin repeat protein